MSVTLTRLFDPVVFDDVIFDTNTHYIATVDEPKQLFDEAIFDAAVFDTTRGGVVDIDDSIVRQLESHRSLSVESVPSIDLLNRVMANFRSLTGPSISISDTITGLKGALRALAESSAITDIASYITPTTIRRLYDKGVLFDLRIFI